MAVSFDVQYKVFGNLVLLQTVCVIEMEENRTALLLIYQKSLLPNRSPVGLLFFSSFLSFVLFCCF